MQKLRVVIIVVVAVLAGCKKKEDNAAGSTATPAGSAGSAPAGSAAVVDQGPPASCRDAGKNYAKLLSADPTTSLGKAEPGMQTLMKYSYEEACDTEWSDANKSCVAKATTSAGARGCFDSTMAERLDMITKAELEDMAKNRAANAAAEAAAGSGSSAEATGSAD